MANPHAVAGCILSDTPIDPGAESAHTGPILGSVHDIDELLKGLAGRQLIALVCFPAAMRSAASQVSATLRRHGIAGRTITPLEDVLNHQAVPASPAAISDYSALIGRTPYGIDHKAVGRLIKDRRVLITGAGGSIGSEITRIVATFSPERIILMERSENALFEIDRRLAAWFPGLARTAILHDVVDAPATLRHLNQHKPHIVFHAAAHKHVPLMEDHPSHAVNNNFFGTKSIADAALAAGAERFVLISSDKAVKPTSVMGATKRLAEMYIQALHRSVWSHSREPGSGSGPRTAFCMVRFGNVLGSACSVLPIWSSQIAEGGPVTVTDPRMTRYFMTIDEAASLVIQAGAIDTSDPTAHVYVLDMGEPVRILDLASRFVHASGFTPRIVDASGSAVGHDAADGSHASPTVTIRLTGARPGEKLHEELAYAAELLQPTPYPGINAWAGPLGDDFSLASLVADLTAVRGSPDREVVMRAITAHVPDLAGRPSRQIPESVEGKSPQKPATVRTYTEYKTNNDVAAA